MAAKPAPASWPYAWQPAFLAALRNSANIRAACQAADISRALAYAVRKRSARFSTAWDEALDDAVDTLEAVAWQRARAGSDFLLWRLMASLRREKYGDKPPVDPAAAAAGFDVVIDERSGAA